MSQWIYGPHMYTERVGTISLIMMSKTAIKQAILPSLCGLSVYRHRYLKPAGHRTSVNKVI